MHKLFKLEKETNIKVISRTTNFFKIDMIYLPLYNDVSLIDFEQNKINKDEVFYEDKNYKVISSISGIIKGTKIKEINNKKITTIEVENDFQEKTKFKMTINKKNKFKKEDLLNLLEKYHLNDLKEKLVNNIYKNLLINSLTDEPYVLNELFILKDNKDLIFDMIDLLKTLYHTENNLIIMKNIDDDIVNNYLLTIGSFPEINLSLLNDLYLLEKDYFLLEKLNLKKEDSLILKPSELLNLYSLINYHHPLNEKYITITGEAVLNPRVMKVKIYSSVKELLSKNIKIKGKDLLYIKNGLMTGISINPEEEIIDDSFNSLIIIESDSHQEKECLKCGLCNKVCPLKINPVKYFKNKKVCKNCLDCGLCSYICPAYINLRKYLKGDKNE